MFPRAGSQIFTEPGSPEDFHVMEPRNVSRDAENVTAFRGRASGILIKSKRGHWLESPSKEKGENGNHNASSTDSSSEPKAAEREITKVSEYFLHLCSQHGPAKGRAAQDFIMARINQTKIVKNAIKFACEAVRVKVHPYAG
jgi:hypothetical protein